ncbi:MAG: gamma-glutamyl-gamma-aminobutyrate hydrolase family protein, partial [Thermohalobaculum sp.]|nr:gamma-glutamyl-gamma-aminobutyrate hydrolase family protein [Thermohalobaculum sp.]
MSRPVVGISASAHLIEESYRVQGAGERTLEAVAAVADALPIMLPGLPDAAATGELVELLDGLVLTGARANVHPQSYGEAETAGHGPFDQGRDGVTLPLIRAMVEAGKPVFGICRGIQEMNVAFGGTLHPEIRDLPGRLNHRMPRGETDHGVIFAKRHVVRFSEGGRFHGLLGVTETVTNSLH